MNNSKIQNLIDELFSDSPELLALVNNLDPSIGGKTFLPNSTELIESESYGKNEHLDFDNSSVDSIKENLFFVTGNSSEKMQFSEVSAASSDKTVEETLVSMDKTDTKYTQPITGKENMPVKHQTVSNHCAIETTNEIEPDSPRSAFSKVMAVVFNVLFYTFLIAIVVGSTVFAFSKDSGKSYFGYRFYNVLSNSMVPNEEAKAAGLTGGFKKGDLILVRMVEPETIQVGDIITFAPDADGAAYLTHRVVEIKTSLNNTEGLYFVTRGDANNTDDSPISAEMVVGKKVFAIPYMGTFVQFVRNNFIPVVIFIVSGFALIIVLRLLFAKQEEFMPERQNCR